MTAGGDTQTIAYGDFQTPDDLARAATALLRQIGIAPATVIEPSCGKGAFLAAAAGTFRTARLLGADINAGYIDIARGRVPQAELRVADFFEMPWAEALGSLPQPWLILGNPPWVTVSGLGAIGSANAPARQNAEGWRGIDAITGRSNFDISEWMLREYLGWLDGQRGAIAVLCKTMVARKVLTAAWKIGAPIARARLYRIDAAAHFDAAVDAGLLVIEAAGRADATVCEVFDDFAAERPRSAFGLVDGLAVADVAAFMRNRELFTADIEDRWRSGIKHDCSAVMELRRSKDGFVNGLGEQIALEPKLVFPLLKSADLANGRFDTGRVMLVPQMTVCEDTAQLAQTAPVTWEYLTRHAPRMAARKSSIYRDKPAFSIFGVGSYSFTPWKVAISGLYKRLTFTAIGPIEGRPVVFDDTVSFLACASEDEARHIADLLNAPRAQEFLNAMIFWTDKRPITTGLLRRLSLKTLRTTT